MNNKKKNSEIKENSKNKKPGFLVSPLALPRTLRVINRVYSRVPPTAPDLKGTAGARMSSKGVTTFYKIQKTRTLPPLAKTFLHELGHLTATQLRGDMNLVGDARWVKAMIKDNRNVSTYAQKT